MLVPILSASLYQDVPEKQLSMCNLIQGSDRNLELLFGGNTELDEGK